MTRTMLIAYTVNQARNLYAFDKKALAQANKMKDKQWRSVAMRNLNKSRARLRKAMLQANRALYGYVKYPV